MAEEQKNVEVPVTQETKPESTALPVVAPEVPIVETTKPAEETPVETAPVTTEDKVDETKPAETTEEAPKAEEKKEEVKPVEEGHLGHKATGLSFPKNLIASKEFFFFGSDAVERKSLSHYLRTEKSTATAHSNIAWASHTGLGLLFVGDKKAPSSVISLSDATEPETDGSHKFHFTSKGNKHSFKATSTSERDNWVSQLKLKIAEAKELAATVTESEAYKSTIESFKPAPIVKKEEKTPEAPKEEAKTEEVAPVVAVPAIETPKEEEPKEEPKKEEVKTEEPKRRSASRKRASFFGFGKKDEKKVEEKKEEAKPTEETPAEETPVVEAPVAETTTEPVVPVVEPVVPVVDEVAPVTEATPAAEEPKAAEETPVESPKEKPPTSKRNSFFGGVFSKKEKKSPELKPTEPVEAPKDESTETAPVIPPVEATTPLAVDVSTPATVPTETTEVPAATNGEPKKDVKEKRKSSLPFAFGKREKSPGPSPSEEKKASPFSKLRATIKGKTSKAEEKPSEEVKPEEAVKEEETKTEETPEVEAPKVEEPAKAVEPEAEVKPENVATTTPAVTAAA